MTAVRYAYVGSRTTRDRNARGDGISVYRFDAETARLQWIQTVEGLVNPSFLAINARKDRLYTVHGDGHEISVFAIHADDGRLTLLQRQACGGRNPVHLVLSPDEAFLVVSDHLGSDGGGSLVVMPVAQDGRLGEVCQRVPLTGEPGPHRKEQPFAKPHFNPFDPSGRFILVPDKGVDRVFVFRFQDGRASPAEMPFVMAREGAGPRHIACHPSGQYAYAINELDSTVTSYRFDPQSGQLHPLQILPSLPSDYTGNSRAAEIELTKDGRWLYASNRGHDSIAAFQVDAHTGLLTWVGVEGTGGRTPRFFTLTPDDRFMLVLNEDSDDIRTFAVNPDSGRLTAMPQVTACGSPVCLIFG